MKRRPRVLQVLTGLEVGGAERMLVRILPHLTDFDQRVVSLTSRGPMATPLEALGIPVGALSMRRPTDLFQLHQLRQLIQTWQPDLVIGTLVQADLILRIFRRWLKIPRLISNIRVRRFDNSTHNWLNRFTLGQPDYFLFNAPAVAHHYQKNLGLVEARFSIIPNGLDLASFKQPDHQYLRQILNLPSTTPVVIGVGRLVPQKDWPTLLRAWATLKETTSHCVLVGEGPELTILRQLAQTLGVVDRLHFLGRRDDVAALLAGADLFVLPTLYEGMSNAILEAMAMGLAVVTTAIPENLDLITNQVTGRLIPIGDIAGFRAAIQKLLANPSQRHRLGQAAQAYVTNHFSLDQSIKKLQMIWWQQIRAAGWAPDPATADQDQRKFGATVPKKSTPKFDNHN